MRVTRLGSGPPLVLPHGYPGTLQIWCELTPRLVDRFTVIAPDRPGHCRTGPSRTGPEGRQRCLAGRSVPHTHGERFRQLIDWWKPDDVRLVGADMGGQPTLVFAARVPERMHRLVVMNSLLFGDERTLWEIRLLRKFGGNRFILRSRLTGRAQTAHDCESSAGTGSSCGSGRASSRATPSGRFCWERAAWATAVCQDISPEPAPVVRKENLLNRRLFLIALIWLTLSLTGTGPLSAESQPNVLLISIDDLNDWTGCLGGHPQAETPHIDGLAERGMLFTNAHCQAPICGPSRAALLSGRYPYSTGVYEQPDQKGLPGDRDLFRGELLPEYFAQHGYDTLAVGKITHGYPHEIAFPKYGGRLGGFGPKPGDRTVRFHYEPDWSLPWTGTQTDWGPFPDTDEKMPDHKAADWAVEQLGRKYDRPFFLAVGFFRPHVPFYVPQKWFDRFPLDEVQLPEIPADDLDDVPETARRVHEMPRYPQLKWLRQNDSEQLRRCVQAYLACTTFVDHQVGRVLQALEERDDADNTVVVLFSDHGYHLGEKHRVCKHGLWEEATHIPLIVRRPGQKDGGKCAKPVGLIDLYPTLVEMCGLPERAENEGRSLVRLLDDPETDWRFAISTTYGRMNHALRSEQYRFIRYEDGSEELYDHAADPHEWTNLADDPEHQDVLYEFRAKLPETDAPHHESTRTAPVNAWFKESFERHRAGADPDSLPPVFDGKTLDNWMRLNGKPVTKGWEVVDGTIRLNRKKGRGGNIVTRQKYGDFDLSFEWKIAARGNSGLKYRVRKYGNRTLGCEFQIYDDGRPGKTPGKGSTGSLYALFAPDPEMQLNPPGEFNSSRIIVRGDHIEHWMNGRRIVSAEVGSPEWDKRVASSKFSDYAGFSRNRFGRIMLTDHGAEVWYRHFKIRRPGQTEAPDVRQNAARPSAAQSKP